MQVEAHDLSRTNPPHDAAVQRNPLEVDLELEVSTRHHVHFVELGAARTREKLWRRLGPELREREDLERQIRLARIPIADRRDGAG
jgi:hypothetical protein